MTRFHAGDIGATKGRGIAGWLSRKLFVPHTDRFHFFLIGDYSEGDEDHIILESITRKGISVGWLSWYSLKELEVYRVNDPNWQELGRRAFTELTKYGRSPYDYLLVFKLFLGAVSLILRGKLPPWKPSQLPYARNSKLLCTEAVNEAWMLAGRPIIPLRVVPLPAGFQQALNAGKLIKIFPPEKLVWI